MCWSCNPICGGCRPPRKKSVKCPDCGQFNVVDLENFKTDVACRKCGMNISKFAVPKKIYCALCGDVCYNSCRKGREAKAEDVDEIKPCPLRKSEPFPE